LFHGTFGTVETDTNVITTRLWVTDAMRGHKINDNQAKDNDVARAVPEARQTTFDISLFTELFSDSANHDVIGYHSRTGRISVETTKGLHSKLNEIIDLE